MPRSSNDLVPIAPRSPFSVAQMRSVYRCDEVERCLT